SRGPSVAWRADRDPPPDDQDLAVGEERRSIEGHSPSDDVGPAFELLDSIAVVGIARDDANRADPAPDRSVHELIVRDVMNEVDATRRRASGARVAIRTG